MAAAGFVPAKGFNDDTSDEEDAPEDQKAVRAEGAKAEEPKVAGFVATKRFDPTAESSDDEEETEREGVGGEKKAEEKMTYAAGRDCWVVYRMPAMSFDAI